jgi:hypothetical protein
VAFQIEIFTNCYSHFGAVGALDGIRRLGIKEIELSIETLPGVLDIPQKLEDLDKWDPGQIGRCKTLIENYGLSAESGFIFVENTDEDHFALDKIKFDIAAGLGLKVVDLSVTEQIARGGVQDLPESARILRTIRFRLALELHPPLYDNAEVFWKVADSRFPLKANFDTANVYYYNESRRSRGTGAGRRRLAHIPQGQFLQVQGFHLPRAGGGDGSLQEVFRSLRQARVPRPRQPGDRGKGRGTEIFQENRR